MTTIAKTKKIRRPGELLTLITEYLKRRPGATVAETAAELKLDPSNARNAMRRLGVLGQDKKLEIAKGSALGNFLDSASHPKVKSRKVDDGLNEQRLLALVGLLGLPRAEQLIQGERLRIQNLLKGATA